MEKVLKKIIDNLKKLKRPVVNLLLLGLTEEDINKKTKGINLNFPKEFYNLYSIVNGTKINTGNILNNIHFIPGYYLLSLDDAILEYKNHQNDETWDKHWFPIFANGAGDYFCIDCSNVITNENEAPILGYLLGEPEQIIEYLSLNKMLKTVLECYENGIYYVYKTGRLEIDIQREKNIAKKLNPGLMRWE